MSGGFASSINPIYRKRACRECGHYGQFKKGMQGVRSLRTIQKGHAGSAVTTDNSKRACRECSHYGQFKNVFAAGAYLGGIVSCPPFFLTSSFSKKEQNSWCQVTQIRQTLLMVSVDYGRGRIQGVRMRGMHPPTRHFSKCF